MGRQPATVCRGKLFRPVYQPRRIRPPPGSTQTGWSESGTPAYLAVYTLYAHEARMHPAGHIRTPLSVYRLRPPQRRWYNPRGCLQHRLHPIRGFSETPPWHWNVGRAVHMCSSGCRLKRPFFVGSFQQTPETCPRPYYPERHASLLDEKRSSFPSGYF